MITTLFSSIERVLILALLLALAYATYQLAQSESDLNAAQTTIKTKNAQLETLSIQAEYLSQSVKLSEQQNQKLMRERDSISRINSEYERRIEIITSELAVTQFEIDSLRGSHNETVKTWANNSIPCDAISLLKYTRTANCN
ncbi:hypothetical protein [Pseudoalteromonas sp.]|uniref:hypothetical protein n=1 Tax=Pseudoalteromonas sp. TaxID=53249 RepID=UPI002604C60C|nr:hypothetical protein [Pseudoalteromonas sp.]MCP4588381.1 hypothetical protein [Pseudoalteromonas sp.]